MRRQRRIAVQLSFPVQEEGEQQLVAEALPEAARQELIGALADLFLSAVGLPTEDVDGGGGDEYEDHA